MFETKKKLNEEISRLKDSKRELEIRNCELRGKVRELTILKRKFASELNVVETLNLFDVDEFCKLDGEIVGISYVVGSETVAKKVVDRFRLTVNVAYYKLEDGNWIRVVVPKELVYACETGRIHIHPAEEFHALVNPSADTTSDEEENRKFVSEIDDKNIT